MRSWQRCSQSGRQENEPIVFQPVDRSRSQQLLDANGELLAAARPELSDLAAAVASAGYAVLLTDRHGNALAVDGAIAQRSHPLRAAFRAGVDLSEGAIGTNAMAAYALEAAGTFRDVPDETENFDLAWIADEAASGTRLWDMLKAVDPTFAITTEREFQARNSKAYEVELLVAPSRAGTLAAADRPRPIPLPEQEWLLPGRRVDQVVPCRDGSPARIVAPDPRWFALHKLWLGAQAKRDPLKRRPGG